MTRSFFFILLIATFILSCSGGKMEQEFQVFLDQKLTQLQPLEKERNLAYWKAAISGKKEDFEEYSRLDFEYENLFTNHTEFETLKKFRESGQIKSELPARQLHVLYRKYLGNQIDSTLLRQITELEGRVENKFSVFRGKIDDSPVSNNEILTILKNETHSAPRQQAWEASKMVGTEVAADLIGLVKLRNQAAKTLGFENYYVMSLTLGEQDEQTLLAIFDGLAVLTEQPFRELKAELDAILAGRCGITPAELRPWHYHDPFFQEAPMIYEIDLDQFYANHDVKQLTEVFYRNIGLPVDSIFAKSDIYEKAGKNPHAFCTHLDRAGDVRVLMNLKNDVSWMETSLHEMGHGVYDRYLDFNLPYLLREPAHAFTTEAIAMFFGRLARNPFWMQSMLGLSDAQTAEIETTVKKSLRLQQILFSRWCQVMLRFERGLYTDPDQDLNKLWWDLVEKYQFITRPENRNQPDWAAKIHFTIAPVYYHNYLLGELMASQLHAHLVKNVLRLPDDHGVSYVGSQETGTFLQQQIFQPGNRWMWNDLLRQATGEPLNPEYFVTQFVR